jgi:hypothetical protein
MAANAATYAPSSGDRLVPGAASVSELGTSVGGFIASCGFAALAAVQHVITGAPASDAADTALTQQAVAEHQTVGKFAQSGQATPSNIKYIAGMHGINFLDLTQSQAVQIAGIDPVEVGVSNARAFGGSDSNVSGHYVTILGEQAKTGNLIVSDPNQPQSEQGQLNIYSQQQLSNAQPFWFGAPSASSGAGSGNAASSLANAYTPPGFPGPIWNPGVNIGQAVAGQVLGGLDIGGMIQAVLTAFTTALKRIGVFAVGLALVAIGLYVALRPQLQQAGKQASRAALLAA